MAKRTIKINLKLPAGVTATAALAAKATKAAQAVVDAATNDIVEAEKLSKELAKKGIRISAKEILARKSGGTRKKSAGGVRKRVVLSDTQRKALVADLKKGSTVAAAAKKYGVSTATVMNIKSAQGLTKKRAAKKKK